MSLCSQCGFDGTDGCLHAFHELCFWTMAQPRPPFIHQVAVDAYAAQHLSRSLTPIQQWFGLVGLCMVCERGATGLDVQCKHVELAARKGVLAWPLLPESPATFAVHVGHVTGAEDKEAAIREWAEAVWAGWEPAHALVRGLLDRSG